MPRTPKSIVAPAASLPASPPHLFVGTSGWAYPSWKPGFYPKELPARAFLQAYAARLTAVEVNYTFRALPTPAQLESWIAATPAGFRFSFKAPQRITHFARLRNCEPELASFLDALQPMQMTDRLGPVLFQLPPNFAADPGRLGLFLEALQRTRSPLPAISFEFRHDSWFTPATYDILREHAAALCIADTDDLTTPDVHTAPFRFYRLRRDGGYTPAELQTLAERFLAGTAQGAQTYVFFRHQDEPTGALNAMALLAAANAGAAEERS